MSRKDDVFAQSDLATEDVTVREWRGVTFRMTELGAEDRLAFEEHLESLRDTGPKRKVSAIRRAAALIRFCARDPETGAPSFTAEEEALLAQKPIAVLMRVARVAERVAFMGDKELEKLAGESGAVPSGASPSA